MIGWDPIVLVFMRVLAGYANVGADRPLGSAPDDAVPGHVGVVLNVLVVQVDGAYGYEFNVLIERELIILCHILHDLINVRVFLTRRERIPNDGIAHCQAIWVP
jgi:hypothetical protein